MAYCFARLALEEGLDEVCAKQKWGDAGARLFGDLFGTALAAHVNEKVREFYPVGAIASIHEIAQVLTTLTGTDFATDKRTRGLDWSLALEPKTFARCPPAHCPVKGCVVQTIWRRIA